MYIGYSVIHEWKGALEANQNYEFCTSYIADNPQARIATAVFMTSPGQAGFSTVVNSRLGVRTIVEIGGVHAR